MRGIWMFYNFELRMISSELKCRPYHIYCKQKQFVTVTGKKHIPNYLKKKTNSPIGLNTEKMISLIGKKKKH